MICDLCKKQAAARHFTKAEGEKVSKLNLCEACAAKPQKGLNHDPGFELADLLLGLGVREQEESDIFNRELLKAAKFHVGRRIFEVSNAVSVKLVNYFEKHPHELQRMNRRLFEELIAELFMGFGYEVELTAQTRDGGKDIIAVRNDLFAEKLLIECKRPNPGTVIGVKPVRELLGVKSLEGATKAVLATTAFFSKDAKVLFERKKWELEGRDFNGLQLWLKRYRESKRGMGGN